MTAIKSISSADHGKICDKCGDSLIAPDCVEYFDEERLVLNLWTCTTCGNRFETEWFMPVAAKSKIESKVLEEFFPSLLVA